MNDQRCRRYGIIGLALLILFSSACARPRAHIMPMRDIDPEQQARDRAECDLVAGYLDVTKPIGGSVTGQLVYTGVGAAVGLLFSPLVLPTTSDPKEVALRSAAPLRSVRRWASPRERSWDGNRDSTELTMTT